MIIRKQMLIIALLAVILFSVSGCVMSNSMAATEEAVGITYIDPDIDMFVYIEDPDWAYQKGDENGQVFFYLPSDSTGNNAISISSQEVQSDMEFQSNELWDALKQQIPETAEISNEFIDIAAGEYTGKELDFFLEIESQKIDGKYILWSAGNKIYICTVTADESSAEKVYAAVDNILKSFCTYQDLEERR